MPVRNLVIGLMFLLVAGFSGTAAADDFLRIQEVGGDPGWYDPIIYDNGAEVQIEIWLEIWSSGANTVQFKLDLPVSPELTLVDVSMNPTTLYLGSPETGVTILLIGCKTSSLRLCTLTFQSTGLTTCYPLLFVPDPQVQSGQLEEVDCSSHVVPLYAHNAMIAPAGTGYSCAAPPPPTNPSPVDGATDQPLSPTLDWDWEPAPLGCGLGECLMYARFGTDLVHWQYCCEQYPPLVVGPLEPNTTYYWQVVHGAGDWGVSNIGPLWSFTTTDGVGVETSTWGRIKALYQ